MIQISITIQIYTVLRNSTALKKNMQRLLLKRSPITNHTAQKGANPSKNSAREDKEMHALSI